MDPVSGALSPVAGSPFPGAQVPYGAATDGSGKFLYVSQLNANAIVAFTIDPATGALALLPGGSFPTGDKPIGIATDPAGSFLFVGNHMSDAVTPFAINSTSGDLTSVVAPPPQPPSCNVACHVNPLRVTVHPSSRFAYVANVGNNTVSAFSLNGGAMTAVASALPTGQHPFGLAVEPGGNFVYVANKVDSTISAFSINPMSGALTPIMNSPFPAGGSGPVGIVIVRGQ